MAILLMEAIFAPAAAAVLPEVACRLRATGLDIGICSQDTSHFGPICSVSCPAGQAWSSNWTEGDSAEPLCLRRHCSACGGRAIR